jgi:hypothetical protein
VNEETGASAFDSSFVPLEKSSVFVITADFSSWLRI